jgi:methyltransferase (TIGR00027 family)
LDDVVDTFACENKDNDYNVVILGAGYDTRCYRLSSIMGKKNVHLYEVDARGTQRIKRKALKDSAIQSDHVEFVHCDFEHEDWLVSLQTQSTFNKEFPTVFVWEGVTMYLDLQVVYSTISKIAICGDRSCIAFDYMFHESMNDAARKSAERIGEPWKCTIDYNEMDNVVAECQKLVADN